MDYSRIHSHIDEHLEEYLDVMRGYLRIPGFSPTGEGIRESAEAMLTHLKDLGGCEDTEILRPDRGNPVVFGRISSSNPDAKTLLLYTWYDLVPIQEGWKFPPLGATIVEPEDADLDPEVGQIIVARGASHPRGNTISFLSACNAVKTVTGDFPVNIIFLVEGEEEIGSPNIGGFWRKYAHKFADAEAVLWPGFNEFGKKMQIYRGAKGLQAYDLMIKGGEWGGSIDGRDLFCAEIGWVDAPVWRLIRALNTLVDENDWPAVDNFWDDFQPPSADDRADLEKIVQSFDEEETKERFGFGRFKGGRSGKELHEAYIMNPWINIHGLWAGYRGENILTTLPMEAHAKIDVRITPCMDSRDTLPKLRAHFDRRNFKEIEIRTVVEGYSAQRTPTNEHIIQSIVRAAEDFGTEYVVWPTMKACAPLELFELPCGLTNIGTAGRMHRQDEYVSIEGFRKATKYFSHFLHEFGRNFEL